MIQVKRSTLKRYISSPVFCPFCESEDIEGGDREIDDVVATQDIVCRDCDGDWVDVYRLVDVKLYESADETIEIIEDDEVSN